MSLVKRHALTVYALLALAAFLAIDAMSVLLT